MRWLYEDPLRRKLNYVDNLASLLGIKLSMGKWEFELPRIYFGIGFNATFRFNLDFYLLTNLHFEIPEIPYPPIEKIEKARYGISKYNKSIYDPEQITSETLEGMVWDFRYKTTFPDCPEPRMEGQSIVNYANWLKDSLVSKDVKPEYVDGIFDGLMVAEAKTIRGAYVGFACVDVSQVLPPKGSGSRLEIRLPTDYASTIQVETYGMIESWVGFSRVGYARVTDTTGILPKETAQPLNDFVEGFRQRAGMTPITQGLDVEVKPEIRDITKQMKPPKETLYQRIFFYQKYEKMHWEGGKHQIRLQNIINKVKRILNEHGVIAQFRGAYIAFAQELYYLYYSPHRKYKQWKKILTDDDLVEKYKRFGCDVSLLNKIRGVVSAWRQPEMKPE